jgi:hypothetical protein
MVRVSGVAGGVCRGFPGLEEYATERDLYLYPPTNAATGATPEFAAFVAAVNATLADLASVPSLSDMLKNADGVKMTEVDLSDPNALSLTSDSLALRFSAETGAISSLVEHSNGREWVAPNGTMGEFR